MMQSENNDSSLRQSMQSAVQEFSRSVQEAAKRLGLAAERFSSITENVLAAIDEVEIAAGRAKEAQSAAEAVEERMERDHAELTLLMNDLRVKIGALAVLAKPMPLAQEIGQIPAEPDQVETAYTAEDNEQQSPPEAA